MAAPASVNIKNLQGKWVLNKTLSDNPDPVLALQGIGWLTRKAVGLATVTQNLKQSPTTGTDGSPTTQIDIDQTATGGVKGSSEKRTLDWQFRGHSDWLFGTVQGRTRYNTIKGIVDEAAGKGVKEADAKFLVEGWLPETQEGEVVESWVENEGSKWTAWQIWGFTDVKGERYFSRTFAVRRTDRDEVVRVRLYYDWAGEL